MKLLVWRLWELIDDCCAVLIREGDMRIGIGKALVGLITSRKRTRWESRGEGSEETRPTVNEASLLHSRGDERPYLLACRSWSSGTRSKWASLALTYLGVSPRVRSA